MKKILKQGNTNKYRAKCTICDTEFEYQSSDVCWVNLARTINMLCVECPNCGSLLKHPGNPYSKLTTESL